MNGTSRDPEVESRRSFLYRHPTGRVDVILLTPCDECRRLMIYGSFKLTPEVQERLATQIPYWVGDPPPFRAVPACITPVICDICLKAS